MKVTVNPSIRTQLLAWLVIPILVLLLVGAGLIYGLAISLATDAYDRALLDSVYSVANYVHLRNGQVILDLPPAALAMLRDDITDRVYYQVTDASGNLIAGDPSVPSPNLRKVADLTEPDYYDSVIAGEDVRIALVRCPVPKQQQKWVYIQVAETVHSREAIGEKILINVILPQMAMVVISVLVLWFGVARGLRPLVSVRDAVAARSPLDLRPIALENTPREVRPLVQAINQLLQLLSEDIAKQRRFVANAAHQLRTPIAGLKMQSELALRQNNPEDIAHALNLIHVGAERAARLANQLLALARAEPGALDETLWQDLDLNLLAKDVCRELVGLALSKDIDLGFEEFNAPVMVHGDQASLHELISNLIENAVLYTSKGGHITVRTLGQQTVDNHRRSILIVEDNGPGIAAEEREKVFERFYRVSDSGVSGTGLGLAIVSEIAKVHKAQVMLDDGPNGKGTSVTVDFPAPKESPPQPNQSENAKVLTNSGASAE